MTAPGNAAYERYIARQEAEKHQPIDDDTTPQVFELSERPLVIVGAIHGKLRSVTRRYGLVEWIDPMRVYRAGWALGPSIKIVENDEWEGDADL